MKLSRTLSQYVLREVGLYAGVGLIGVSSVLVLQNLVRRLGDLGGATVSAGEVLGIAGSLCAMLASYAVPVAFLFGVLAAVGRLSGDSEWTAMKALGVSLAQFSAPVVICGALVAILTGYLLHSVEPRARRHIRATASEIAASGSMIQPGKFIRLDGSGERLLFVEERDEDLNLSGVVISDRTNQERPFTVFSEGGDFAFDRQSAIVTLTLRNGDIHFETPHPESKSYRRIAFGEARYTFDLSEVLGARLHSLRPPELDTSVLLGAIANFDAEGRAPEWARVLEREPYEIQLHRRFALPVAPFLFAIMGVPLGLRRARGARSWGVFLCVAIVFGYYAALSVGITLAENGTVPASISLWMPNLLTAGLAFYLIRRARLAEL
jgi:lipopolysaccharide export system permease protein